MPKSTSSSDKIMGAYFSALLQEEQGNETPQAKPLKIAPPRFKCAEPNVAPEPLEKLLQQVEAAVPKLQSSANKLKNKENKAQVSTRVADTMPVRSERLVRATDNQEPQRLIRQPATVEQVKKADYRPGQFQALFFDVAGLTLAVPLVALGGIHELAQINSLMGKPDWFKGVMLHRERKINVVDSARWVMPEKCDSKMLEEIDYRFIIMLGNSHWGLMAEKLVDTVLLSQDDVKWREHPGKRPWLAGLVKDRMCALVDVDAMISLLAQGLGISPE